VAGRLESGDDIFGMEALGCGNFLGVEYGGEDYSVGFRETFDQLMLEDVPTECVRTWLEDSP